MLVRVKGILTPSGSDKFIVKVMDTDSGDPSSIFRQDGFKNFKTEDVLYPESAVKEFCEHCNIYGILIYCGHNVNKNTWYYNILETKRNIGDGVSSLYLSQ
jgi:hypothetical protein